MSLRLAAVNFGWWTFIPSPSPTWNSISLTLRGLFSVELIAWKKAVVFTMQTCSSGCVPTTAGVFAFNSGILSYCVPLRKNMQIAVGCFKCLISMESIPSLKSKTSHPSHNFCSLQIPYSLTFTDICSQPQRACLSFLPFSLVSGLSLVAYPFKYSLINIYLPWLSVSLPKHKDWKSFNQSYHWSTPLLRLSSVKKITQPWKLAPERNMFSNSLEPISSPLYISSLHFFSLLQITSLFTFTLSPTPFSNPIYIICSRLSYSLLNTNHLGKTHKALFC